MRTSPFLLAACSLSFSLAAQGPLPPLPVPPQNPITPAKTILGKLLFWEEQLSSNNRVACGTCHTFAAGGGDLRRAPHPGLDGIVPSPDDSFGSPGLVRSDANNHYLPDVAFGLQPQITRRASPSFLTAAWFPEVFWDGRARTNFIDPDTSLTTIPTGGALENQALGPLLSSSEMAHDARTFANVTQKLVTARPMALATNLPADMAAAVASGGSWWGPDWGKSTSPRRSRDWEARLHAWCSGPVYRLRSWSSWPRSHAPLDGMGFPQRAQLTRPVATLGTQARRKR